MSKDTWKIRTAEPEKVEALIARGMKPAAAAIMAARGLKPEEVQDFLNPRVRNFLPKFSEFPDLAETGIAMADTIRKGRKIGIFTDYDCDGATSGATLELYLRMCGTSAHRIYVPDRVHEGYGPNEAAIRKLFDEGVEHLFILDSGTMATGVLNPLPQELRDRISIIDHHLPGDTLPEVKTVLNPNRKDQAPGYGQMCAAGVTWLACLAANRALRQMNFKFPNDAEPNLMELLDVVALGTVADVVPLVGINRAIVAQGLELMRKNPKPSIRALLDVSGAKGVGTYECGFMLGPRINAAGRIGNSMGGVNFLIETDPGKLQRMAMDLHETNIRRKDMERAGVEQALQEVEMLKPGPADTIVAVTEAHEGVVGIIAARLKERELCPTIVLTPVEDGMLKGSARSIEGFDIGTAIHDAVDAGIVAKGGGHFMAAGLTLEASKLNEFRAFMNEQSRNSEFGRVGPVTMFDASVDPADIRESLEAAFTSLEPCGTGNLPPRVLLENIEIDDLATMGKDPTKRHLRFNAVSDHGSCPCVIFNVDPSGEGDVEKILRSGAPVTLAGKLQKDTWRDKVTIKFMVDKVTRGGPELVSEPDSSPQP